MSATERALSLLGDQADPALQQAARVARCVGRGIRRSLTQQAARLLLGEADDEAVLLPRHTLAAMLGVRRPSLNKVLKRAQ